MKVNLVNWITVAISTCVVDSLTMPALTMYVDPTLKVIIITVNLISTSVYKNLVTT